MKRFHGYVASIFLLSLGLSNAETAKPQIDTPIIAPDNDYGDLYRRAAASQLVVVGTVTRTEGVSKRWTQDLEAKIKAEGNLSLMVGGSLYTIDVEKTVCRQSDFRVQSPASAETPETPRTVYIFLPRDEPAWVDTHQREVLSPGQRYLFLLVPVDGKILDNWITTFDLAPHRSYFRGEELSRGVVPLKSTERGVLEKTTRLCDAVRPAELAQKLAALKKLQDSDDPVLQREARAAEENLRAAKPE